MEEKTAGDCAYWVLRSIEENAVLPGIASDADGLREAARVAKRTVPPLLRRYRCLILLPHDPHVLRTTYLGLLPVELRGLLRAYLDRMYRAFRRGYNGVFESVVYPALCPRRPRACFYVYPETPGLVNVQCSLTRDTGKNVLVDRILWEPVFVRSFEAVRCALALDKPGYYRLRSGDARLLSDEARTNYGFRIIILLEGDLEAAKGYVTRTLRRHGFRCTGANVVCKELWPIHPPFSL